MPLFIHHLCTMQSHFSSSLSIYLFKKIKTATEGGPQLPYNMHVNIDPLLLLGVAHHTMLSRIHRMTVLQFLTADPAPKTTYFWASAKSPFPWTHQLPQLSPRYLCHPRLYHTSKEMRHYLILFIISEFLGFYKNNNVLYISVIYCHSWADGLHPGALRYLDGYVEWALANAL